MNLAHAARRLHVLALALGLNACSSPATVAGSAPVAAPPGAAAQAPATRPAPTLVTDRTVLPIPEVEPPAISEMDARKAVAPPRTEVKAPRGAPNVVIVLIDDMGFGAANTF